MIVSKAKRIEYWNHFVARWAANEISPLHGLTRARLGRVKKAILLDDDFWFDIVLRHAGGDITPEQMMADDQANHEHAEGNFWVQLAQIMRDMGVI